MEALLGYEVIKVSCGPMHIMAATTDNVVFAWGKTDSGMGTCSGGFIGFVV